MQAGAVDAVKVSQSDQKSKIFESHAPCVAFSFQAPGEGLMLKV